VGGPGAKHWSCTGDYQFVSALESPEAAGRTAVSEALLEHGLVWSMTWPILRAELSPGARPEQENSMATYIVLCNFDPDNTPLLKKALEGVPLVDEKEPPAASDADAANEADPADETPAEEKTLVGLAEYLAGESRCTLEYIWVCCGGFDVVLVLSAPRLQYALGFIAGFATLARVETKTLVAEPAVDDVFRNAFACVENAGKRTLGSLFPPLPPP
jgi:uncharacterized protein with GYD domain